VLESSRSLLCRGLDVVDFYGGEVDGEMRAFAGAKKRRQ
jgi:hypothetical protein